ncbi:uncharacterized protein V1518DRAFT_415170 [Limtongia smithiae]|uniref:uncharacterized protein n=1 Tax=Limtongia smithiae TaxID=1125753 RepID=UPI0034CFA534
MSSSLREKVAGASRRLLLRDRACSLAQYRRVCLLVLALNLVALAVFSAVSVHADNAFHNLVIKPAVSTISSAWSASYQKVLPTDDEARETKAIAMSEAYAGAVRPIHLLRQCSRGYRPMEYYSREVLMLPSLDSTAGNVVELDFVDRQSISTPSLIPTDPSYAHPYLGFAQRTRKALFNHHEIVVCDMDWGYALDGSKSLLCVGNQPPVTLKLPEWPSATGLCKTHDFMAEPLGAMEPRVFLSPIGEPLMIVSSNGQHACLSQYIIDLRAIMPDISTRLALPDVPITYENLTELVRDGMHEYERSWVMFWDYKDKPFLQHSIMERSLTPLGQTANALNKTQSKPPTCVQQLVEDPSIAPGGPTMLQTSNALHVTMCEFPCIPTIHNTVIVAIVHVKFANGLFESHYRRYAMIMNATFPFDVIGRSNSLKYQSSFNGDEDFFTTTMHWDKNYQKRRDWDDDVDNLELTPGSQSKLYQALETIDDPGSKMSIPSELNDTDRSVLTDMTLSGIDHTSKVDAQLDTPQEFGRRRHRVRRRRHILFSRNDDHKPADDSEAVVIVDEFEGANDYEAAEDDLIAEGTPAPDTNATADTVVPAPPAPKTNAATGSPSKKRPHNPFVNPYQHGWIDDVVIISLSIDEEHNNMLHTTMKDMLDCLVKCDDDEVVL